MFKKILNRLGLAGLPDDIRTVALWLLVGWSTVVALLTWVLDVVREMPLAMLIVFFIAAFIMAFTLSKLLIRAFARGTMWVKARGGDGAPDNRLIDIPASPSEVRWGRTAPSEMLARVQSAEEIWAFWHTGASAFNNSVFDTRRVKRLILPHPDHPEIERLFAVAGPTPTTAAVGS